MSMWYKMQIYDKLKKDLFLFCALERTTFIRKREATNYFRLMTPSVDQLYSNKLVTQRPISSLTNAARDLTGCRVASATGVCLFG